MANNDVNLYDLFKKSEFGKVVEHLEERERMITFLKLGRLEKY